VFPMPKGLHGHMAKGDMIRHLAAALVGLLAVRALAQPITIEGVKFEPRATVGDQTLVLNRCRFAHTGASSRFTPPACTFSRNRAMQRPCSHKPGAAHVDRNVAAMSRATTFAVHCLMAEVQSHRRATGWPQDPIEQQLASKRSRASVRPRKAMRSSSTAIPDTGTRIRRQRPARGEPIAGAAFFTALLRIWLGDKPADTSLKKALLGS